MTIKTDNKEIIGIIEITETTEITDNKRMDRIQDSKLDPGTIDLLPNLQLIFKEKIPGLKLLSVRTKPSVLRSLRTR